MSFLALARPATNPSRPATAAPPAPPAPAPGENVCRAACFTSMGKAWISGATPEDNFTPSAVSIATPTKLLTASDRALSMLMPMKVER
ncbi:hypothetical protein SAMN03159339_0514, partial [Variovorax sp. 770b2]